MEPLSYVKDSVKVPDSAIKPSLLASDKSPADYVDNHRNQIELDIQQKTVSGEQLNTESLNTQEFIGRIQ